MVFPDLNGFLRSILNGVVLNCNFRLTVDPESVVASDWTYSVAMSVKRRITDTKSRPTRCTGNGVVGCCNNCTIVGGDTRALACGNDVVIEVKGVSKIACCLVGIGVDRVTKNVDGTVAERSGRTLEERSVSVVFDVEIVH